MNALRENRLPEGFWERVAQAEHHLIVLDYDGTLAPLQARRDRARPLRGVVTVLDGLSEAAGTTVGVLSGRSVEELFQLLTASQPERLQRVLLLGEHGWENCFGEEICVHPVPARAGDLLARAERGARQMGFGRLLERKRASIVLHTRSLPPEESRWIGCACRALWSEFACTDALRLDEIDGGLELRAAGRDKGSTMRELLAASPPGTLALYIGDDETDEDAFRAVHGHGFGLRVVREPGSTAADGTLASCREVVRWLAHLHAVLRGGPPGDLRSA